MANSSWSECADPGPRFTLSSSGGTCRKKTPVRLGPGRPACEEPRVEQHEKNRDDDRADPGNSVVVREDRLPQDPPDDRSQDPENDGHEDAYALPAWHDQSSQGADDGPGDDVDEDRADGDVHFCNHLCLPVSSGTPSGSPFRAQASQ